MIFDSTGKLIQSNAGNLGGKCYQDIMDDLCNNKFESSEINDLNGVISLDSILANSQPADVGDTVIDAKYIVAFGWVTYMGMSLEENSLSFIQCIKDNPDYYIMSVNLDYSDAWFPAGEQIPEYKFQ